MWKFFLLDEIFFCILLCQCVCGLTNLQWAPEVKHYIPDVPMMLVGTKVDLREEGAIDPTTGKAEPIDTATVIFFY